MFRLTGILFFLLLTGKVLSQSPGFIFSHLNTKEGLSDNVVTCFLKDSRGRLWIGTINGLNRYDGAHFYVFKKSADNHSLFNGNITALCEDKAGNIWGSTEAGVFCFNPLTGRFRKIATPNRSNDKSFTNVLCDQEGNIWATGLWTLLKYNPQIDKFEEQLVLDEHPQQAPDIGTRSNGLLIDTAEKEIWITTRAGLVCYEMANGKKYDFSNQPGKKLFDRQFISALARSPGGLFWCFNNSTREIILFDPAKKEIVRTIGVSHIIPGAGGVSLYEDKNHRLWFSSWTGDCLVIDYLHGNKMEKLTNRVDDKMSITNGYFTSVLEDEDGILWFGTVSGISKCSPDKNLYKVHYLRDKIPDLKNTSISVISEDPADKTWWMATIDRKIINYSPATGNYRTYIPDKAVPDKKNQLPGGVFNVTPVGNLVVIATATGAWQINKTTHTITPFAYYPAAFSDFTGKYATALGDSVCFLTDGKQILRINLQTGKFIHYAYPGLENEMGSIGFMFTDNEGRIWANSNLGRIVYTTADNQLATVKLVKDEENEFSGYFNTLDPDNKGNIWVVSTGFGLYRYHPSTGKIKYWDQTIGLLSPYIQKNKTDRDGNVWLLTYSNVSVFLPATNDFYHFTIPFAENTINYFNSINRLENGNIIASILNEVFEFFPGRINLTPVKRRPEISLVNASGKDIMITQQEKLLFQPQENTLRFRFGLLTDASQFPYQFEYRLEGAEEGWTKSAGINEAIYNSLPAGDYKFRVRAIGMNNPWHTGEAVVSFTIKAPFYKTTWFFVLVALLVSGILFFLYRYRMAQKEKLMLLENKAQMLEKEKAMVMYESLKQQLNPHFLFNSLTSLSGLIETNQQVAGDFLEQMSGIYRYILKNGNNETVSLKDEIEFVQLYINLQQTRFKKGLQVNIRVPDEYLHYKIAPVTLQNLIENAIKHNVIDIGSPLVVDIFIEGDYLVVKNNLQRKKVVETSNMKGLAQFTSLYRYLSELPVIIEETEREFIIKIPLI